jgi:hypothetical protein
MKRFLPLLALSVAMIASASPASACLKKSAPIAAQASDETKFVLIVMDTTQALLPFAEVTIGKTVFRTSFDGRVVLASGQMSGEKAISVACEGYETKKITGPFSSPLVVALTPKPGQSSGKNGHVGKGRTRIGEVILCSKAAETEDGLYYAVDEAADAKVYMASATAHTEAAYGGKKGGAAINSNVSAGRLTAGEVNDFARWNFWQHVLNDTHKRFISDWRMEARERYTVQLTNQAGYPLANRSVDLLDAQGNTLFQTVTDNTGKAELWRGLVFKSERQEAKGENLMVRVDGRKYPLTTNPLISNLSPLTVLTIDELCEAQDGVDVMFVFDATGSMGDELRYLQAEMKDVIARAKEATGGLNIRTGALVYRDHGDEYLTRISRLTDDISTTQQFIDKQHAGGGGDYEEAVPEALMAALNSGGWDDQARTRIAFLILDAPCHQDSATVALMQEQILNAASQGVRIVPVVCSGLGESGELLMRTIALATNGTSFFLTDDSGIGHPHLRPTTDSLKVEHLNDMLVRTIVEFSYMPECVEQVSEQQDEGVDEQFIPNPFDIKDLEQDPTIAHGPTALYLMDITGKLIASLNGDMGELTGWQLRDRYGLSSGVYFLKAFYDGQWHTKKLLVQ